MSRRDTEPVGAGAIGEPAREPVVQPVLAVNAGSSSLRLDLIAGTARAAEGLHHRGDVENEEALLRGYLGGLSPRRPRAVVHRLVHGGLPFSDPVRIDDGVMAKLEELTPLAPLHLPRALRLVRAARRLLADVPQVAVFDTGFFSDLPTVAATYALPRALCDRLGLRRFGFHGLAHAAMWQTFADGTRRQGRVITLQLGSGCSTAALLDGRPLDTSMGFTPTEGRIMATRSGDLDPGLVTHLVRTMGFGPDEMDRLLNTQSGLAGLSQLGGDIRQLLGSPEPAAQLAVNAFCYRVRKYIGAYAAVLGGLDAVVFGGGIGENSPEVRARCLEGLGFLGLAIDPTRNQQARGTAEIGRPDAPAAIWTVAVDEAAQMAREALTVLQPQA